MREAREAALLDDSNGEVGTRAKPGLTDRY
jgi:hypothetical protein